MASASRSRQPVESAPHQKVMGRCALRSLHPSRCRASEPYRKYLLRHPDPALDVNVSVREVHPQSGPAPSRTSIMNASRACAVGLVNPPRTVPERHQMEITS